MTACSTRSPCPYLPVHAERPRDRHARRHASGSAVLLPGAQGLVADGRRDLACGAAGVVLAYIAGLPLAVGAFASGMICALATGYLKENSRIKEDTVMGMVFSGMFGLGIVLYTKVETERASRPYPVRRHARRGLAGSVAERDHRGGRSGHHCREVAGSAAACLRSAAGPGHGPAGATARTMAFSPCSR